MKRIKVSVTAKDIALGFPTESGACPIALAVGRCTGLRLVNAYQARIYGCRDVTDFKEQVVGFKPPRSAVRFMNDYDDGRPVKPFSFFLVEP